MKNTETNRVLVWEHAPEINRITSEIKTRLTILNALNEAKLSPTEIKQIAISQEAIHQFILDQQLKTNKELAKLRMAGVEVTAKLPENLESLRYSLMAWFNYPAQTRGGNKFSGLYFTGTEWQIDSGQLERHFEMQGLKVYVEGERLTEFNTLKTLAKVLTDLKIESGQVSTVNWLHARLQRASEGFDVRGEYFRSR